MGAGSLSAMCTSHLLGGGCPVHGHKWGVFSWALSGLGARWLFDLLAVVVAHGCGALFAGAELLSMGAGLLIVGGGACLCGWVVHGCWYVVCGHSGDMLSAMWSPLARSDGKRVGVLTINN